MGSERIPAVDDVSFTINQGEFCCLLGTSGSGKSTLLNLMAGIEKASAGQIMIKGYNICKMNENRLARFRQRYLGFVFQSYNLINSMTALENVEFPLVFKRIRPKRRRRMAAEMLDKVGLRTRMKHKPKQMSGGQQQRVGIARAFVAKPEIVFADEPTGNLDTRTTMEVMKLIHDMARTNGQTIVMVTHDRRLADFADKVIHILDGKIQNVEVRESMTVAEAALMAEQTAVAEETADAAAEATQTENELEVAQAEAEAERKAAQTEAELEAAQAEAGAETAQPESELKAAQPETEPKAAQTETRAGVEPNAAQAESPPAEPQKTEEAAAPKASRWKKAKREK